jgi:hypothetical protein
MLSMRHVIMHNAPAVQCLHFWPNRDLTRRSLPHLIYFIYWHIFTIPDMLPMVGELEYVEWQLMPPELGAA